jgi:hypothetical protein
LKEICFLGKQEIKKQMINVDLVSSGNKEIWKWRVANVIF